MRPDFLWYIFPVIPIAQRHTMTLNSRIEALKQKHDKLEKQLREESGRASADPALLHQLKSQKLSVKDEIEKLSKDVASLA